LDQTDSETEGVLSIINIVGARCSNDLLARLASEAEVCGCGMQHATTGASRHSNIDPLRRHPGGRRGDLQPLYSDKLNSLYALIDTGAGKYAFAKSIFNAKVWKSTYFFTMRDPWRDLVSDTWWGSILILGPLPIFLWGIAAVRYFSNGDAVIKCDEARQPFVLRRRAGVPT